MEANQEVWGGRRRPESIHGRAVYVSIKIPHPAPPMFSGVAEKYHRPHGRSGPPTFRLEWLCADTHLVD